MPNSREPGVVDALGMLPTYGEELVMRTVRDTHQALAGRTYGVLNRLTNDRARPVQVVHDEIFSAFYAAVGMGLGAGAAALTTAGGHGIGPRLEASPRGRFIRSALNGILGDRMEAEGSPMAITTSVRVRERDVPPHRDALATAFPSPTGSLAIFLHGLSESESYWDFRSASMGTTYARTVSDLGFTPVMLRLNSGRTLRESGLDVAALLRDLVSAWPVEVSRVSIIGHSMGGLIARAACGVTIGADQGWTDVLTDVVTLGSPHTGAPVAVGLGHGSRFLARLPETSAFGRILDQRSVGIEDLVDGLGHEFPPLAGVRYRLVSAAISESPEHPVGRVIGDIMVRMHSAHGRSRHEHDLFPDADVLHVPRCHHFDLLNHPHVHDALGRWLR